MAFKGIQFKIRGQKAYPNEKYEVGDLYLTTRNENPSVRFGGTWELFGPGRTLVCVDTSDTDFNTVKKTGGAKTHSHSQGATESTTLNVNQIPAHNHSGSVTVNNKTLTGYFAIRRSGTNASSHWEDIMTCSGIISKNSMIQKNGSLVLIGSGPRINPGYYDRININASHNHSASVSLNDTGGTEGHTHTNPNTNDSSTLQPFITCYVWIRTA